MKKFFVLLLLLAFNSFLFSQNDSVYNAPEQLATFPGGELKFKKFINKNTHYPQQAYSVKITRPSYIRFIVEKDGSISNVSVLSGIPECPDCNDEALRVIQIMPNWNPAKQGKEFVRSAIVMPFKFN